MAASLNSTAQMMLEHHRHSTRMRVLACLAAVVVFCVTYALMLPAITMEKEAYCGHEEHAHSDACYEMVLVCGHEETPGSEEPAAPSVEAVMHTHSDACYTTTTELTCSLAESTGHTHSDTCYTRTLTCADETEGHEHGEACYATELSCGLEESEGHAHSDTCYSTVTELTCGLEEGAVVETATADAAAVASSVAPEAHVHTDACYERRFVCEAEEHEHALACYSNPDADVESAIIWEATLPADDQMTGVWADDLLLVAKSQLGYAESSRNYVVVEDDKTKGYTRYGAWYGDAYGDWCAMFVSFCLHYAGIPTEDMPQDANCQKWINTLSDETRFGLYVDAGEYEPEPGDLVFFDWNADGTSDHVGIVSAYVLGIDGAPAKVETIEGNTSNLVAEREYAADDATIMGYAMLPEKPAFEAEAEGEETDEESAEANEPEGDAGVDDLPAALTQDDAFISEMVALSPKVVEGGIYAAELSGVVTDEGGSAQDGAAADFDLTYASAGDLIRFPFEASIASYSDTTYSSARVRVEFVLPLPASQATFDLSDMGWLDSAEGYEPEVSVETRVFGDAEQECQVLSGWAKIDAAEGASVVPGLFAAQASVKLIEPAHNEQVALLITACMEHGTWEGSCEEHGVEEAVTVATDSVTVDAQLSEEEQLANYEAFLAEIEELEESDANEEERAELIADLRERVETSFASGAISAEQFSLLMERVEQLEGDEMVVGEMAEGTNWMALRDSGWFEEYSGYASATPTLKASSMRLSAANVATASDAEANTFSVTDSSEPSDEQIDAVGGANANEADGVSVSKTIDGTDLENVFDITLAVTTNESIEELMQEPDMAVVIVMDISNTMRSNNLENITRYEAAMIAAEGFLDSYAANTSGASKVGYVAFNTNAHEIFGLSSCSTAAEANALKNTMRTETGNIINAEGYAASHTRFTNVEAGLKMGYDMLAEASNPNKYIIFLSDGFPTTYISSGYTGYDPYTSSGTVGADGVFHDDVLNLYCVNGNSYSDKAAIRARQMATTIKNSGTKIFSIGVDVGGQTIKKYIDASTSTYSIVDRTSETYEIGNAEDTASYATWLKEKIGSGYYYDSTNIAGLEAAYDEIFAEIKVLNALASEVDWVTEDPMPVVQDVKHVEFIGFFDKDGNLVSTNLIGASAEGAEDTAEFDSSETTIYWDLKTSGYESATSGSATTYTYELVYRVRLKNELASFVENTIYNTNDKTTLSYKTMSSINGVTSISPRKTLDYPIPAVHGFLGELSFNKVDSVDRPVVGAEFTLTHDTDKCSVCRGDGTSVDVPAYTATSDAAGSVAFASIPSGHTYALVETKVPVGYAANPNSYQVVVAYDETTVTVTDASGAVLEWGGSIVNAASYELPQTGGRGVHTFIAGGLLMIAVAALSLYSRTRKEEGVRAAS